MGLSVRGFLLRQKHNEAFKKAQELTKAQEDRAKGKSKTSEEYGGDWTQSNPNYSFNRTMTQAKEMAQFQLDNAGKQMEQSYNFRNKEANNNSDLRMKESDQSYQQQRGLSEQSYQQQRGLGEQQYGFQRGLSEQSYQQQRGLGEQRNAFDVAMVQLQDNLRQNQVNDNRSAANSLFFGRQRARGNRRF